MCALITGGAGFLGSHLTEYLLDQGHKVTVLDNMEAASSANLKAINDNPELTVREVELLTCTNLSEIVSEHEQVYHLAAKIGGVGYLRDKPATIIADNDAMNRRVFEACVEADIDRLLFASSSMLYSEAKQFPTPESKTREIPPPAGSYGFQKLNGEYYCDAYQREYGLEYVSPRIFNAVGPRDWPKEQVGQGHVIPDMVRKIIDLEQNPVSIKGTGQQTRCFTDVRDIVRGLYRCMEVPAAANQAFNLGTTDETSIREVVELIWDISGKEGTLELDPQQSFEKDVKRRVPNTQKAKQVLNWEPNCTLRESLEWYISNYRERRSQRI